MTRERLQKLKMETLDISWKPEGERFNAGTFFIDDEAAEKVY